MRWPKLTRIPSHPLKRWNAPRRHPALGQTSSARQPDLWFTLPPSAHQSGSLEALRPPGLQGYHSSVINDRIRLIEIGPFEVHLLKCQIQ